VIASFSIFLFNINNITFKEQTMVFKYLKQFFFYNRRKRSYLGESLTIAAKSYQKAAEQGHITSQYILVYFTKKGKVFLKI